jgi:hypothetical protein
LNLRGLFPLGFFFLTSTLERYTSTKEVKMSTKQLEAYLRVQRRVMQISCRRLGISEMDWVAMFAQEFKNKWEKRRAK